MVERLRRPRAILLAVVLLAPLAAPTRATAAEPTCATAAAESPSFSPADEARSKTALDYLNQVRTSLGIPALRHDLVQARAAKNHMVYLSLNRGDPSLAGYNSSGTPNTHFEVAGKPGFTGVDDTARTRAIGGAVSWAGGYTAGGGNPVGTVRSLLDVPLHRVGLLGTATLAGYATYGGDDQVQLAYPPQTDPAAGAFVVWPYSGMTGVRVSFGGPERPDPVPAPYTQATAGYAITVQRAGKDARFLDLKLVDSGGTEVQTVTGVVNGTERPNLRIPTKRLAPGTTYVVTATLTDDAHSEPRTWSFTTAVDEPLAGWRSATARMLATGGLIEWGDPPFAVGGFELRRTRYVQTRPNSYQGSTERTFSLPGAARFFVDGGPFDPDSLYSWAVFPLEDAGGRIGASVAGTQILRPPSSVAESYHSQWVRQSPDPTLDAGQVAEFSVEFANLGNAAWVRGSQSEAHLALNRDDQRPAREWGMNPGTWLAPDRLAVHEQAVVCPGEVGRFRFSLRAPQSPGDYALNLRPVIDGVAWMEDNGVFWTITVRQPYHAGWLGQSPYPVLRVGETGSVTVTYRNTGSSTWVKGKATEARLGVNLDDRTIARLGMAVGWPFPERPAVQSEASVAPGGTATFTFQVKGVTPGQFSLHLRPVIDGITWMEDEGVFLPITVR